ncbi:MAG: hypothetical protein ACI8Q3_002514, partial [Marinomonas primoryensis]
FIVTTVFTLALLLIIGHGRLLLLERVQINFPTKGLLCRTLASD